MFGMVPESLTVGDGDAQGVDEEGAVCGEGTRVRLMTSRGLPTAVTSRPKRSGGGGRNGRH